MERSKSGGVTSRLALQMQVISLIGEVFTVVLPTPFPKDMPPIPAANGFPGRQCVWRDGFTDPNAFASLGVAAGTSRMADAQRVCLQRIHKLMTTYTSVWQAVESPVRSFDSERGLVASSMFAIFDACLRTKCLDGEPLVLSELLSEDGGYSFSTGLCQNNREFSEVAATMELVRPELAVRRGAVLSYLESVKRCCANTIFYFRQPVEGKMEFKKHGSTVMFLRKFLERSGIPFLDRSHRTSEMEALMNWLLNDQSPLAKDKPEFLMLRDVVCLLKFLTTMETRQAEILRRRVSPEEGRFWRLTFDEGGTSTGRRGIFGRRNLMRSASAMNWEVANVRGADLSIADVRVLAFGDRELAFGEGPVVHSPASVSRLLGRPGVPISEDDVLHCDRLPTFGETLSRSESELLMSYLTVDYMRIPLVIGFFANSDRVTYLFDSGLQNLLRFPFVRFFPFPSFPFPSFLFFSFPFLSFPFLSFLFFDMLFTGRFYSSLVNGFQTTIELNTSLQFLSAELQNRSVFLLNRN